MYSRVGCLQYFPGERYADMIWVFRAASGHVYSTFRFACFGSGLSTSLHSHLKSLHFYRSWLSTGFWICTNTAGSNLFKSFYSFEFMSVHVNADILTPLLNLIPVSQSPLFTPFSFSLLHPSLTLVACGGLWVNFRFFISLFGLGGKHACKPLWEMSVSVCRESRGPFTSHRACCHTETAKWRLTGHSIEPNHLYQMWQQGKEDVW